MDDQIEALSHVHRRRVLVELLDHDPQSDGVVVPEGIHKGQGSLESLSVELHHKHLPKLEEAGLINWDQDKHQVTKGPKFNEIRELIEFFDEQSEKYIEA